MKQSNALLFILIIAAAACGKKDEKDEPKTADPTPTPTEAADPVPTATDPANTASADTPPSQEAPVELPPETEEDIKNQCASLLKANWTAIQPALVKLQIPDPASLEEEYVSKGYDSRKYLEACALISQVDRKCLSEAEDSIAAPLLCGIDSAKAGGKQFQSPKLPGESPLLATSPIGKASLKAIAGTWLNKGGGAGETTWTISKKGKTKQVRKNSDGTAKPEEKNDNFTLSFTKALSATRQYPGSNAQTISFFMSGPSTFFTSGNLLYAAYDMKDGKTFVAKNDFDWVFSNEGACEVVTRAGQMVPATCETKPEEGANYFHVEYQVPGKVHYSSGAPEPTKVSYLIDGNHLLPKGLVRLGRYDKQ